MSFSRTASLLGLFAALTTTAHAHMAIEGAGDIANGALHPILTPVHVLVMLALGLWLGQQVPLDLKTPTTILAPVSAITLILTTTGRLPGIYPPLLIGLALIIASLVGLEIRLPRLARIALCAVVALMLSLDSAVETGGTFVVVKTLLGTWFSLNAAILYIAICASHAEGKPWARVGIRILGSWIIAISLMVLAFSLRK